MRRRLVVISSFVLATGLGMTSLTESSASLAATPDLPSSLAEQRVLDEQLQVTARAHQEEQAQAAATAAAEAKAEAERVRKEAEARAARTARATARRVSRPAPPGTWEALIARYPWDVSLARQIMWCESRGDPAAENAGANGLFQIQGGPFEPAANVALAYQMYRNRGWQPWYSSRTCWS